MVKCVLRSTLCLGLLVLSGCRLRKRSKSGEPEMVSHAAQPTGERSEETTRISLFDEHEGAFVLEEDDHAFVPEGAIRVAGDALFDDHRSISLEVVYFAFDSDTVAPEYHATIDRIVAAIMPRIHEGAVFVIEGHACNSAGSAEYNMMLSEKRAQNVRKMLVKRGIPSKRLKIVGRGFEMCKVPHGTREQQAPNRRVEIYELTEQEMKGTK